MSETDGRDELAALQAQVAAELISIEEVGPAFERLTYRLRNVSRADDAALHALANDIERIRFSLLPADQRTAVAAVLRRAEPLLDRRGIDPA